MNEATKKTVPVVGHRNGLGGQSSPEAFQSKNILPPTATESNGFIASMLPHGAENAISTPDLVRMAGMRNSRSLQNVIAAERERGALILSTSKGGYFLPDDGEKGQQEILEFVRTLRSRAINTLRALHTARQALGTVEGQSELEGW